jgi:hypothetical protein
MTEQDYRIEELFEPENMRVYFSVWFSKNTCASTYTLGANPQLIRRQFETLEEAKDCVRMCRKYKNRVFHYVED